MVDSAVKRVSPPSIGLGWTAGRTEFSERKIWSARKLNQHRVFALPSFLTEHHPEGGHRGRFTVLFALLQLHRSPFFASIEGSAVSSHVRVHVVRFVLARGRQPARRRADFTRSTNSVFTRFLRLWTLAAFYLSPIFASEGRLVEEFGIRTRLHLAQSVVTTDVYVATLRRSKDVFSGWRTVFSSIDLSRCRCSRG